MSKYIVKDWAGIEMNWGEFSDFDYAVEAINLHALDEMSRDGIDTRWTEDRNDGTEFDEALYDSYCSEYFVYEKED
jgi:hypothetical protein